MPQSASTMTFGAGRDSAESKMLVLGVRIWPSLMRRSTRWVVTIDPCECVAKRMASALGCVRVVSIRIRRSRRVLLLKIFDPFLAVLVFLQKTTMTSV